MKDVVFFRLSRHPGVGPTSTTEPETFSGDCELRPRSRYSTPLRRIRDTYTPEEKGWYECNFDLTIRLPFLTSHTSPPGLYDEVRRVKILYFFEGTWGHLPDLLLQDSPVTCQSPDFDLPLGDSRPYSTDLISHQRWISPFSDFQRSFL